MKALVSAAGVALLAWGSVSAAQVKPAAAPSTAGSPGAARAASFEALVEAERAFSRLSGRIGQAPAFLAYFSDNVVTFRPQPVNGKDALRRQAASAAVPPVRHLDWEPWVADVAESGDFGYTTGPAVLTEIASGKTLYTGWYFSVWRKQAGVWHVVADIGVAAPAVASLRPAPIGPGTTAQGPALPPAGRVAAKDGPRDQSLLRAERELEADVARNGAAAAYGRRLAPGARLHRDGVGQVTGPDAIAGLLGKSARSAGWRVVHAEAAASGDLGFTYGVCQEATTTAPGAPPASFLHVWKADGAGWRLAAEVVTGQ